MKNNNMTAGEQCMLRRRSVCLFACHLSCPLRRRAAHALMEHLAEIGIILIPHAGGHVAQRHIRVLTDQVHRGVQAALRQVSGEGRVAVLAEQAAQVGLGDADLRANALDADGCRRKRDA